MTNIRMTDMKNSIPSSNNSLFGRLKGDQTMTQEPEQISLDNLGDSRPPGQISQEVREALHDLTAKAATVVTERDAEQVQFAQLEIQVAMLHVLNAIDWKLWEIHNKFVK